MIPLQHGIHIVTRTASEVASRKRVAEAEGWRVYTLVPTIRTADDVFAAVGRSLPLNPPPPEQPSPARSWDAMSDSLFGGFDGLVTDRVLLHFPGLGEHTEAYAYRMTREVLADVSETLSSDDFTQGNPTELCVWLGPPPE
ncbi:MAG: hypothetical protein AAGH15_15585 [Myxococcota bacterium]